MEEETNTYQQFNFQIALEKIELLTEQNNELLDTIDKLERQLRNMTIRMSDNFKISEPNKFKRISEEADAAIKRFSTKLRKELSKNGKSKQGKGEPV
jgi:CHASE3 domain sensor protein